MTAEIPEDKVARTTKALLEAMEAEWVGAKEVQSLLWLLGF